MKFLLLALIGFFSVAGSAASEEIRLPGIKGNDDRRLSESHAYPWRAIGRVNRRTGGFCTGTLIGETTILTAAHCLWNQRTLNWLPPSSLHFVAAYNRGDYAAEAAIVGLRVSPAYLPGTAPTMHNVTNDWAILTLAKPIGRSVGWLPVSKNRKRTGTILQAGYSQDKAHILTVVDNCQIDAQRSDSKLLVHDCDATKGDSGSPILVRVNDFYEVLAIHSATTVRDGVTYGLAVPAAGIPGTNGGATP